MCLIVACCIILLYTLFQSLSYSVVLKKSLEEECSVSSEEAEQACKEYNEKMDQLAEILKQEVEPLRNIEGLVKELKGIKLPQPIASSGGAIPDTKKAIADAKAAVAQFGADSVEARLAWETVEEIASSDNSQVSAASLDEECLLELEEACQTLHDFSKLIDNTARL
jgi:Sec-independent protein translocase protein TatA